MLGRLIIRAPLSTHYSLGYAHNLLQALRYNIIWFPLHDVEREAADQRTSLELLGNALVVPGIENVHRAGVDYLGHANSQVRRCSITIANLSVGTAISSI
jgi:hypothetical protein